MGGLIVCDASALIGWLDSTDAHHERAARALAELVGEVLGTSTLTLAEVLVGAHRNGRAVQAMTALAELELVEIGLEGRASELAELRSEVGLPMPDCCVLLAAQISSAAPVLSFDARLSEAADSIGLPTLPG